MEITNTAKKPLSIPLPAGKKLFLGPGKTGQITQKAAESKPILKLIEAGELKLSQEGAKRKSSGDTGGGVSNAAGHGGTGAMRQSGDK